ncbi:NTP transferase domain-containing protein [Polyangium aurulentum]|nr:NTP transferase domain-containing protein [Polyangium aurulentum]
MLAAVSDPSDLAVQPSAAPPRPLRQAVVLAGGLATRMYPRTRQIPKFLLPVAGRPFGHHLLARLAGAGYDEIVLCIGHLGDAIRQDIGDGRAFGLEVRYADEGEARLGTAGALRGALSLLAPVLLVTYGDSYLPFDYAAPLVDLLAHPEALGTMAVYRNADLLDASNCEVSGERVVRYEKRRVDERRDPGLDHIDYGAIALRREVIAALPEGPGDLAVVQRDLARAGRLRALPVTTRFYEIGSEAGYRDLEAHLEDAREEGAR